MRYFIISTFVFFLFSAPVLAENAPLTLAKITRSTGFAMPIKCEIGENCWIMNYVDFGPDDGKKTDPACGPRTYDGHKGTDFAIRDDNAMRNGVDVIAPLDGRVLKIRDGEPDQWSTPKQIEEIKAARKECGNAVIIEHDNDIQTIYCHMKNGSIKVKPNQEIKQGDKIGEVGLSGMTQFPHLHFGITKAQKIIDPFTRQTNNGTCGLNKKLPTKSLWQKETGLKYQPFTIQSAGFSNTIPDLSLLEKNMDAPTTLPQKVEVFTFWSILFGLRKGDIITLEIHDPNGKKFAENVIEQPKDRARQFYYIGKNIDDLGLKEGAYTGTIKIERPNQNLSKNKISTVLVID